MRAFFNFVENLVDGLRLILGIIVLGIMGVSLILSFGLSYAAPEAAGSFAESAARSGEKTIELRHKQRFAEDMAKDGWSYSAATASTGQGELDDGWAD